MTSSRALVEEPALNVALDLIIRRLRDPYAAVGLVNRRCPAREIAKRLYRERRLRRRYLPSSIELGEPGWDVLLDLYIASGEQRMVSVSSACIAADVPSTTALRWIARMVAEGILQREEDPNDQRRSYVGLTGETEAAITAYLSAISCD